MHPKPDRAPPVAEATARPRLPLGRWLVDKLPRGANLDPPRERGSARPIPFAAGNGE